METETEEITTSGRDGLPDLSQDTPMYDRGESRKKTTDRKMEVMSAKTKTSVGFSWTAYETGCW